MATGVNELRVPLLDVHRLSVVHNSLRLLIVKVYGEGVSVQDIIQVRRQYFVN